MRLATWNINGVVRRLPLLVDWLSRAKPDVVALQETKATDAEFPKAALAAAGYGAITVGQRPWNGVALLARGTEPIMVRRALPGDPGDTQARYVEAAIEGILFASIYLPNGNPQPGPKFAYKLAWFERLAAHAASLIESDGPVVLAGDYNVVATDEVGDIYSPRSYLNDALLQPETRSAYRSLLGQGWTDSIHHLHPGQPIYTYWDYFRNRFARDAGLRIDHLLLNPPAFSRLRSAGVDKYLRARDKPSDHAPTWIELSD